jgi:biopolymer transport protein ExbB
MNGILDFLQKGGVMMYPLILSSILMIALILERFITLRKEAPDAESAFEDIRESFEPGTDPATAIELVKKQGIPGRVFARGLLNSRRDADSIEMAMELEATGEVPSLEANLAIIKTIVNIAPLLGLLGTIAGMISSFRAASQVGLSNPTQILGGISEALISTATGIGLAVVGFIFHNYFSNRVRRTIEDIEYFGAELVNYLTGRVD